MLDHDDSSSVVDQCLKDGQKRFHVLGMQADRRLVKNENRVILLPAHFRSEFESLRLSTRQAGRLFPECQVAETQVAQDLQPGFHCFHFFAELKRRVDVHIHKLRQGTLLTGFILVTDLLGVI